MTSPARHSDLLILEGGNDGICKKEDTHVASNNMALLSTDVPSPTCVSFMSTAKRTTITEADAFKSPRRMNSTGFANMMDEDAITQSCNKKQRFATSDSFSWFNKPTHQEISKIMINNDEEPQEEGTAECSKRTMSLNLPQELKLPSLLFIPSSENDKDDLQELQSSARDRRIRPRLLTPAIRQMNISVHHKTTKAVQPCLFDPDELCQVSSSSKMNSRKREASSLTNKTQARFLMLPSLDSTF